MGGLCSQAGSNNQESRFQKIYQGLSKSQELFHPSQTQQAKRKLFGQIYCSVSSNLFNDLNSYVDDLQTKFLKSKHKTSCLQQIAQLMQSMHFFFQEVLQAKNAIKNYNSKLSVDLKKLLDKKKKSQLYHYDNNNIQKQSMLKTSESNIPKPKAEDRQNLRRQEQFKVEARQRPQESNPNTVTASRKLTNQEAGSVQTYSLPMNVLQMKQRQKQAKKLDLELQEDDNLIAFKQINKNLQDSLSEQQFQIQQLKKQLSLMQDNKKHLLESNRTQIQKLESTKIQQTKTIKHMQDQIYAIRVEYDRIYQQNQKMKKEIETLQSNNNDLQAQLIALRNERAMDSDLRVNSSILSKTNNSNLRQNDYFTILKYFCHSTLLPSLQDCQVASKLRLQLTGMFHNKRIKSTKLIYAFDPLSQLHYEKYIKNKENLFVLLKLEKQVYVGGFMGQIDQNQEVQDTFLFSISAEKNPIKLTNREKVKKINYQQGFLNFGNGEIKIKCRSLNFTCNVYGINTKYFGQGKGSIQRFLGSQERSCQAKGYEIYQIELDYFQ